MNEEERQLDRLWHRGKDFLGVEKAILGGAMSWVSERSLVSAISNAGGFGVLACGSMSPDLLRQEISATKAKTQKPYGVNLIIMHPELETLLDVCLELDVSHIVLAGGLPSTQIIMKAKSKGSKVLCFAPTAGVAKKLIRNGADALIIEGSEAGGHIGPVSTLILAQEILPIISDVPVFVAGGIGRGETIISYLELGASGVQLGTRFVCAEESIAHPHFKKAFIKANSRDAIASVQLDPHFPVIPVRALENEASRQFLQFQSSMIDQVKKGDIDQKKAMLAIEHYWAGALRRAVIDGDIDNGSLMAGQSVGLVTKEQSTQAIIDELLDQALSFLKVKNSHTEYRL
jgi:enoyl-[acyl-carrier protein] reductase II